MKSQASGEEGLVRFPYFFPRSCNQRIHPILTGGHPRRVVLLSCFEAGVPQQPRNLLNWHALAEQPNCEGVPQTVRRVFRVFAERRPKQPPQIVLPRDLWFTQAKLRPALCDHKELTMEF